MKKPFISVIMPAYNSSKYINYSIKSIINQTFKSWELIIVNDASTDNTYENLKKIKNKKIKIINLRKNIGTYRSIEKALKTSKGTFIAFHDSDDISYSKRFKIQYNFLKKRKDISLVASSYKIIDQDENIIKSKFINFSSSEVNLTFPCENLICNSSVMFKKKILQDIKFYNKNYSYSNDYFFFLRVFKKKKIKILKNFLVKYRIHDLQRTQEKKNQKLIILENISSLNWSKKNGLITHQNFHIFFRNYLKNIIKYFIFFFKSILS